MENTSNGNIIKWFTFGVPFFQFWCLDWQICEAHCFESHFCNFLPGFMLHVTMAETSWERRSTGNGVGDDRGLKGIRTMDGWMGAIVDLQSKKKRVVLCKMSSSLGPHCHLMKKQSKRAHVLFPLMIFMFYILRSKHPICIFPHFQMFTSLSRLWLFYLFSLYFDYP